jgi:hypothetical protein
VLAALAELDRVRGRCDRGRAAEALGRRKLRKLSSVTLAATARVGSQTVTGTVVLAR